MLATSLEKSKALDYLRTADPSKAQAERAADFGRSERHIRRYETYLRGVLESIYALFEPVTFPLPRLDRTFSIRVISFPKVLKGIGTYLGLIYKSLSRIWDRFGKEILNLFEDSESVERELEEKLESTKDALKESLSYETDSIPRGEDSIMKYSEKLQDWIDDDADEDEIIREHDEKIRREAIRQEMLRGTPYHKANRDTPYQRALRKLGNE